MKEKDKNKAKKQDLISYSGPAPAILDSLILSAVSARASDVHIFPFAEKYSISQRVDGLLQDSGFLDIQTFEELLGRIKIECRLRTDQHVKPLDGKFQKQIKDKKFDIRVSIVPVINGRSVVLRILDQSRIGTSIESIGFTEDQLKIIEPILSQPSGMVLVCGPTGSGKTTTLYACMNKKISNKVSCVSIEDPVEYQVGLIKQIQVNHEQGFDFASGLRAILRQDPDTILVGEMRDEETAKISFHAALTGHFVCSTVHASSAVDALFRLYDLGVQPFIISHSLKLIIAQRLVRRVCTMCAHTFDLKCKTCLGSGFFGREAISEIIVVDSIIRSLIHEKVCKKDFSEHLYKQNFQSFLAIAQTKIKKGITTQAEVNRVLSYE